MEQSISLEGGGDLRMELRDSRVHFYTERKPDGTGLYKVWIRGRGGGRLLLGTLVPEGRQLCLNRTVSLDRLERAGCWPVECGECVLAFRFGEQGGWYCEQQPGRLVREGELARELTGPVLCNKEDENFHLAVPFTQREPLQADLIVTLGILRRINGKLYLVWEFDRKGRLIVPEKS